MLYTFHYSFVADHYQYVASIGPIALAAAGMTIALGRLEKRSPFLKPAFGGIVLLVLGLLTWRQSLMYADAETLWRTTIARNPDAWMAYDNLGIILSRRGDVDGAMALFQKTLAIRPDDALARNNLGLVLCQKGRMDEGIVEFQKALSILPGNAVFRNNLGKAFLAKGQQREAMIQFQKVLENNPLNPKANYYLGIALFQTGRVDEAMAHFQKALESQPDFAEAWDSLDHTAWLLATSPEASLRNGPKALALARQLARLSGGNNPALLDTLAAAYAESGQFPEAVDAAQRALALARTQNNTALANTLRQHIKLFQAGSPLRSAPPTDAAPGPNPALNRRASGRGPTLASRLRTFRFGVRDANPKLRAMSQMLKSSGSMAAATLISRVLGMVREMVYSSFMGDGPGGRRVQIRVLIPNLFRRLLGEGALTAAFIPIFKEKEKTHGENEMWRAANAVISGLVVAAAAIIGVVMLGVSLALAVHQFSENTELMLQLLRVMFPYMLLVCLAAVMMGMLNARGHFFIPAMGATMLNVVMIASVSWLAPNGMGLPKELGCRTDFRARLSACWRRASRRRRFNCPRSGATVSVTTGFRRGKMTPCSSSSAR